MKLKSRQDFRARRHRRLRKLVRGTAARPRLSVFVSNRQMYVQFIDDDASRTLAAVSTRPAGAGPSGKLNVDRARELGAAAARAAREAGIENVVFDRGGFAYAGRIRALADAAREAGLRF